MNSLCDSIFIVNCKETLHYMSTQILSEPTSYTFEVIGGLYPFVTLILIEKKPFRFFQDSKCPTIEKNMQYKGEKQ
jgi:hypothetical protein